MKKLVVYCNWLIKLITMHGTKIITPMGVAEEIRGAADLAADNNWRI